MRRLISVLLGLPLIVCTLHPSAKASPRPSIPPGGPTAPSAGLAAALSRSTPSGQRMPNRVKGWVRTYAEDFNVAQRRGTWPGRYAGRLYGYDCSEWGHKRGCDTSGRGDYDRRAVVSARAGVLDYYVHTRRGLPKVAAEGPKIRGRENSQKYGRYAVRWRVDRGLNGYKNAWLLWPTSNRWTEGEIDFPEGNLDGKLEAFNHCVGNPKRNCYRLKTSVQMASGWHTSVIEWRPTSIKYYLDGRLVGQTTRSVPRTPMRWVLQTETELTGRRIPASVSGHVQIDWMVIWRLA